MVYLNNNISIKFIVEFTHFSINSFFLLFLLYLVDLLMKKLYYYNRLNKFLKNKKIIRNLRSTYIYIYLF